MHNSSSKDFITHKIRQIQSEVSRQGNAKRPLRDQKRAHKRVRKKKTRESRDAEHILQMIDKEVKRSDILIKNHRKRNASQRPGSKARKKKQPSLNPKKKLERLQLKPKPKRPARQPVRVKKKKLRRPDAKFTTEADAGRAHTGKPPRDAAKFSHTGTDWHFFPRDTSRDSRTDAKPAKDAKSRRQPKAKRMSMAPDFKFSSQLNLNELKRRVQADSQRHRPKISLDLDSADILSQNNPDKPPPDAKNPPVAPKRVDGSLRDILSAPKQRYLLSREESMASLKMQKARPPAPKRSENPFVLPLDEVLNKKSGAEHSARGRPDKGGYARSRISEYSEETGASNAERLPQVFSTVRAQEPSEKALPILKKSLRRLKKIEKKKGGYVSG